MTHVNDINTIETSFFRSLGNGKQAAVFFSEIVKSVVSSRDTTVFVRQIEKVRKEKSDTVAIRAMGTIIKAVWPECKFKTDKKTGKTSIVIKGIEADAGALARMDEALTRGLSLRDTFANEVRGEVAVEVDKSKAASVAQTYMKKFCEKYEVTPGAFLAMLAAKTADVAAISQPATPLVSVIPSTRPVDPDAHIAH